MAQREGSPKTPFSATMLQRLVLQQNLMFGNKYQALSPKAQQQKETEFPHMPNINQKQVNYLLQKKKESLAFTSKSGLNSPTSPKVHLHQEFEQMTTDQRVQTAREYYNLIEKEPIFQSKSRLKPVTSESMFREAIPEFKFQPGDSQFLSKLKFNKTPFSKFESARNSQASLNIDLVQAGYLTQRNGSQSNEFQTFTPRIGAQTSGMNSSNLNQVQEKQTTERNSKFTDNTFANHGYYKLWRDGSLDQATRAKVIEKLRQTKQENDREKREIRNRNRSEKALRIKMMMSQLDIRQKDLNKELKFHHLPINQIANELKDISTMKSFIKSVIKIQALARMVINRARYRKINSYYHQKVRYLQGFFRARYQYKYFRAKFIMKREKAIRVIQKYVRGFIVRIKNLIENRRLQKFKQNLDFLEEMNRKQREIQQKELQDEQERLRLLKQQEDHQKQLLEVEAAQRLIKKDSLNPASPRYSRHKSTSANQKKQGARQSATLQPINMKKFRADVQSMIVSDNLIEKLDLSSNNQTLNNNQDNSKESPGSRGNDDKIEEEPIDAESQDSNQNQGSGSNQPKEIIQPPDLFVKHDQSDNHQLDIYDIKRYESLENVPNYMRATSSLKCKEMDLDYEKIHELKKRTKITNNMMSKQEIEQVIDLAQEQYQVCAISSKSQSRGQSKQSRFNSNNYQSRNSSSQIQKRDTSEQDKIGGCSKDLISSIKEDFLATSKELKLILKQQSDENNKNDIIRVGTQREASELSSEKEGFDQNEFLENSAYGQKPAPNSITNDLKINKQSKSEDKQIQKRQPRKKLNNNKNHKVDEYVQTNNNDQEFEVISSPKFDSISQKKVQKDSKEIQVEIIKSKYQYLSSSKLIVLPNQGQDYNQDVIDFTTLTRGLRKKYLRSNLVYDKFVSSTVKYEKDPLRFKCQIVHNNEPFISETPSDILAQNFFTPNELFYVYNHGPVPRLVEEEFSLYVLGQVHRPLRLTLEALKVRFPKAHISATLKCAANRKKEFDQVKFIEQGTQGNNKFGVGGVGTALWGGLRLRDVLQMAQIDQKKALFIEFYGEDIIHGTDSQNYSIALPYKVCMSKKSDILLAYEMNGEILPKDHGYPLRLICPGMIGAKSVKWLSRIMVLDSESPSRFQQQEYKLYPSNITSQTMCNVWQNTPQLMHLNIDCIFTNLQDGDVVPSNQRFVIQGFAIAGQGNLISRVEITFDQGKTWDICKITNTKSKKSVELDESQMKWEWTTWEYVLEHGLKQESWVMVRAFDECFNTQPEIIDMLWNFKGYMNNSIQKLKIYPQILPPIQVIRERMLQD